MTTTSVTAETVTTEQIKALREECKATGDSHLADICDLALAAHETSDAYGDELIAPSGEPVSRSWARGIVASAISGVEYQDDSRSRADLLAGLAKYDDGTGTLGVIVDQALADDPDVSLVDVAAIVEEAICDAKAERRG